MQVAKLGFDQWMAKVNQILAIQLGGLNAMDLPDQPYQDWYAEGITPLQAARRAVREIQG